MGQDQLFASLPITLPAAFYERLIRDIPAPDWVALIRSEPSIKELIFDGFSTRPDKLARLVRQPQVEVRLRRLLQLDLGFMGLALELWGHSRLMLVAFVEMLDMAFIIDNWTSLKDLVGPERFIACLALLGLLEDQDIVGRLNEQFWVRDLNAETLEILLPAAEVWDELRTEDPRAAELLGQDLWPPKPAGDGLAIPDGSKDQTQQLQREQDRRKKVEAKLERAESNRRDLREELKKSRTETELLKKRLERLEQDFDARLHTELDQERSRWFNRYRGVEAEDLGRLHDERTRLDELFQKAERALELQAKADQEYGLVGDIGRRLIRLELYLRELERVHMDSLVVHTEVKRVRQALQVEQKRLLRLPAIDRVLAIHPNLIAADEGRRKIRFMESVPENLETLSKIKQALEQLAGLDLVPDLESIASDLDHKRRQIQETLYHRFHADVPADVSRSAISLDELVQSGESRKYDLYVDGYNIVLRLLGDRPAGDNRSLAGLREAFIEKVLAKRHLFRKIFLVFDGVEGSRERHGNVAIIYSDKRYDINADAVIMEALRKRRDKMSLLVTADREIITATEKRLFGIIEPLHYYSLLFDLDFPPLK